MLSAKMTFKKKPTYLALAEVLEAEIASGDWREGDYLPPIGMLGHRFGVSAITVIGALRELKARGIAETRRGRGTVVRATATTLKPIGIEQRLVVTGGRTSRYHPALLLHLTDELQRMGYSVKHYLDICDDTTKPHLMPSEFQSDVENGRLAGAVLMGMTETFESFKVCRDKALPVVTTGESPCWASPNHDDIYTACSLLAGQGVRHAAVIGWGDQGSKDWLQKMSNTMAAHGISFAASDASIDLHAAHAGAGWSAFRELFTRSNRKRPDGLFVLDEHMFDDVFIALREMKIRVPEDIKLVCLRSSPNILHQLAPIDCLVIDVPLLAQALAELIVRQMESGGTLRMHKKLPLRIERSPLYDENLVLTH